MKILQVHNSYQQPGGEDAVCAAEHELLTSQGHTVLQYLAHNDAIRDMPAIQIGAKTIWNSQTYSQARVLIRSERPEVVHVHNSFPLISPAIYYAAATEGVPVVQTLHNYRLLCPAATFFRENGVCEECLGRRLLHPAVLHRCYRGSALATGAVSSMLVVHRLAGAWKTKIDTYIALSAFSRKKFVEGGLPADRIVVKPNCLVRDPGVGQGAGGYALFAGRLSEEKGIRTLLDAWQDLGALLPLKIAGNGPLAEEVSRRVGQLENVEWLGHCSSGRIIELLQSAALAVVPSNCYENLPMTILESFACGTPVIASALGSLKELVTDGENGLHFAAGESADLARKVRGLISQRERLALLRKAARVSYERNYTPQRNYELLMAIYANSIKRAPGLRMPARLERTLDERSGC